jgi:hypothetical protein
MPHHFFFSILECSTLPISYAKTGLLVSGEAHVATSALGKSFFAISNIQNGIKLRSLHETTGAVSYEYTLTAKDSSKFSALSTLSNEYSEIFLSSHEIENRAHVIKLLT